MSAETLTVTNRSLGERRAGLVLWALALVAVTGMYSSFYPSMTGGSMQKVFAGMPDGLVSAMGWNSLASGAGYVSATIYGMLLPLLLLVFAIAFGSRAIAGEEESGMLDLYLAHPVSRQRLLTGRFTALCVALAGFGVLLWAETTALSAVYDMGIGPVEAAAAALGLALLALVFGTLALAVGAVTGRHAVALGVSAAVAVATYLLDKVAPQVEALNGLDLASPFYYYLAGQPLRSGFDWGHVGVLVAVPLVLLLVAIVAFGRRDLDT